MQRVILPVLMSMVVLSPMAIDIFLASMPVMAKEFKANNDQIQSTISIFFFAMGLGQVFIGPVADKYGRKVVALFGLSAYCLSSLIIAIVSDVYYLLGFRFVQGIGACAVSVVIFSVVRDSFSYANISKIYSYLNGVLSVVPALAPILGTVIAEYFGWRFTFLFMSGYSFIVLCVVYIMLPETLSDNNRLSNADVKLVSLSQYRPIITNGCFLFYAVCCMGAMASILTYVSYAPVWIIGQLNASMKTFSLLFGINASVSILGSVLVPILINRLGNRCVVIVALMTMFICALLLMMVSSLGLTGLSGILGFMLPVMFLSAGLSFILGPACTMALSEFSGQAGAASALLGFIQMVGASLIVFLIQQTSLIAPHAVSFVLFSFVIPLLYFINSNKYSSWHMERYS